MLDLLLKKQVVVQVRSTRGSQGTAHRTKVMSEGTEELQKAFKVLRSFTNITVTWEDV